MPVIGQAQSHKMVLGTTSRVNNWCFMLLVTGVTMHSRGDHVSAMSPGFRPPVRLRHSSLRCDDITSRRHSSWSLGRTSNRTWWYRSAAVAKAASDWHGNLADNDDPRVNENKLRKLEAWLEDVGVDRRGGYGAMDPPSVRLKNFDGQGVGLECARELERDSTVASIPRRVCLSSDSIDAPPGTLRAWGHCILAITPPSATNMPSRRSKGNTVQLDIDIVVVTLQLLLERAAGASSSFAPWMALLPRADDLNLPALWPADDVGLLSGTLVFREVQESLSKAVDERRWVESAIARGLEQADGWNWNVGNEADIIRRWREGVGGEWKGRPTMAEWLQARCMVQSRAYRVGGRYVLIPLVDFANHDDGVEFAVLPGDGVFTDMDEVVITADRSYRPGQHVCTTYGQMDNAKRLFSFGFVTLRRPVKHPYTISNDKLLILPTEAYCDVLFLIEDTDPLRALKQSVLERQRDETGEDVAHLSAVFPLTLADGGSLATQQLVCQARGFIESTAMPLLRLKALTPADFNTETLTDLTEFTDLCGRNAAGQIGREDSNSDRQDECESRSLTAIGAGKTLPVWSSIQQRGVTGNTTTCKPGNVKHGGGVDSAQRYQQRGAEDAQQLPAGTLPPGITIGGRRQLLRRLASPVTGDNERRAWRLLADQCWDSLNAIDLNARDLDALKAPNITAEGGVLNANDNGGNDEIAIAVSQPRLTLCAAVRIAEAVAWSALLEVCSTIESSGVKSAGDCASSQRTIHDWVHELV